MTKGGQSKILIMEPLLSHILVDVTSFLEDIRYLDAMYLQKLQLRNIFSCHLITRCEQIQPFGSLIKLEFSFYQYQNILRIDDWPITQLFYIIIDQWTQSWYFTSNTGTNQCGFIGTHYGTPQYNDFPLHTLNSIIVELYSDCNNNNFWGLTNFYITLDECYSGCQFCFDSTVDCTMWNLWQQFFQLQNLDNILKGWIINKFPSSTSSTNDFSLKMLVLNQLNSAITYLTLPDQISIIIQFRIEYLSALPMAVRDYINDEYQYGFISSKKQVDYRTKTIDDKNNAIKLEIDSVDGIVSICEVSIILG